jgi:hypothetical protein
MQTEDSASSQNNPRPLVPICGAPAAARIARSRIDGLKSTAFRSGCSTPASRVPRILHDPLRLRLLSFDLMVMLPNKLPLLPVTLPLGSQDWLSRLDDVS